MAYCFDFLYILAKNYKNAVLSQFSQHLNRKTPKMLYCPNKPKKLNFSRSGRVICLGPSQTLKNWVFWVYWDSTAFWVFFF